MFEALCNAEETARFRAGGFEVADRLRRDGTFEYGLVRLAAIERDLLIGHRRLSKGALHPDERTEVDHTRGPGIEAHTKRHISIANATDRLAAVLATPEWRGSEVRTEGTPDGEGFVHFLKHSSGARMRLLAGVSRPCEE